MDLLISARLKRFSMVGLVVGLCLAVLLAIEPVGYAAPVNEREYRAQTTGQQTQVDKSATSTDRGPITESQQRPRDPFALTSGPNVVTITVRNNTDHILVGRGARVFSPRSFGRINGEFSPDPSHDLLGLNPHETRTIKVTGKGKGLYTDIVYADARHSREVSISAATNWSLTYINDYRKRLEKAGTQAPFYTNSSKSSAHTSNPSFLTAHPNGIWVVANQLYTNSDRTRLSANVVNSRISAKTASAEIVISEEKEKPVPSPQAAMKPVKPVEVEEAPSDTSVIRLHVTNNSSRTLTVSEAHSGSPCFEGECGAVGNWITPNMPKALSPGMKGTLEVHNASQRNAFALVATYQDPAPGSQDHVTIQAALDWDYFVAKGEKGSYFGRAPKIAVPDGVTTSFAGGLVARTSQILKRNVFKGTVLEGTVVISDVASVHRGGLDLDAGRMKPA